MKNLQSFQVLLLLITLFSLKPLISYAQYPLQVDANNIQQETDNIVDLFGNILQVDDVHISSTMSSMLVNTNIHITPPDIRISHQDENSITFKWPAIQGAIGYRIGYINLETGARSIKYFSPSTNNNYKIKGLEDGLYLFLSQTRKPNGYSSLSIIIDDKVVLLYQVIPPDMACNCPTYTALTAPEVSSNNGAFGLSEYINQGDDFDLIITNGPAEVSAIGSIVVTPSGVGEGETLFSIHGLKNNNVMYLNTECPGYATIGAVGFESFEEEGGGGQNGILTLGLNLDYSPSTYLYIAFCGPPFIPSNGGFLIAPETTPQITTNTVSKEKKSTFFPNPFQDELHLNSPSLTFSNIQIYDSTGKLIISFSTEDTALYQQIIDTSGWPQGMYYCVITTGQEVHQMTIAKTEK